MNKIYTKSIKCISFCTYKTGVLGNVEDSDTKGLNVFTIERNEETERAYRMYKDIMSSKSEMIVDLTRFDDIVKKYKLICNRFNRG